MANTNYPSANEPQNRPVRNTNNNNTAKNIAIGVLAAGLLGTWGYFLYDKNQSDEKIQISQNQASSAMSSKDSVTMLYNDALTRLDSITGSNNNMQGQLSDNQSEITKLKSEINSILRKKNASQAELARAKSLIATLNDRIGNLEAEVARLTGENQELASNNVQLSQERDVLQTNLQTTTAEKEELAQTVDVASTFSASNIAIRPVNEKRSGKEKETTTARRVDKLVISFDVENRVARTGPADLYVIVTAPNGQVINDPNLGSGTLTTRTDGDKQFTSKVTSEYEQGTRKNIQVPLRQNDFQTGDYRIEIYQNGFKIAEGVRTLKKGGLFG
jgi:predicted  nucleic acid-binding Zn-ribbon protein